MSGDLMGRRVTTAGGARIAIAHLGFAEASASRLPGNRQNATYNSAFFCNRTPWGKTVRATRLQLPDRGRSLWFAA
jgi:hypothetical protein